MRTLTFILLTLCGIAAYPQLRAKDLFAAAPDSIFPLLSTNNRLDCIDFIENNMEAKVKNRLDQPVTMTALTDSYLHLKPSEKSTAEIKVLDDSTFCLISTCMGPAPDSRIAFYTHEWKPATIRFALPAVQAFWASVPDSLSRDARFAQRSLEDITLIHISADKDKPEITLTLQTSELAGKEKEIAQKYVQPLRFRWTGKGFER